MGLFGPDVEKLKEKRDIAGLMKALQNKKNEIRKDAAEALAQIGGADVIPGLLAALQDSDARVRVYAVQGFAKIKAPQSRGALESAVADSDWEVRKEALAALIKSESDVDAMLQAIRFNSAELRELAAVRLGDVNTADSVNALIQTLKDVEEIVRLRATNSLKKILADQDTDSAVSEEIKAALAGK